MTFYAFFIHERAFLLFFIFSPVETARLVIDLNVCGKSKYDGTVRTIPIRFATLRFGLLPQLYAEADRVQNSTLFRRCKTQPESLFRALQNSLLAAGCIRQRQAAVRAFLTNHNLCVMIYDLK
ncbi:MAG: hypothetical protein IKD10_11470 [Lentisphaeria bacterium]|nr:hypothetical protein [Lentisphaeria bacterium]